MNCWKTFFSGVGNGARRSYNLLGFKGAARVRWPPLVIRFVEGERTNMKRRSGLAVVIVLVVLLLAACGGDDSPSQTAVKGDEVFSATFDEPGNWDVGTRSDTTGEPLSSLAVVDGRYQIDHTAARSASFVWGAGGPAVENVIVEVDAEQLSPEKDNLYGVACRLMSDERGDTSGYALLISGDGHYGIAEIKNQSLSFLLKWHQSDAIHQGTASNTIRAVCVDNYLAVYANGTFLGEVKDDALRRAGQVGLVAGVTADAAVSVAFDNLAAYDGTLQ